MTSQPNMCQKLLKAQGIGAHIVQPAPLTPHPHIGTFRITAFTVTQPTLNLSGESFVRYLRFSIKYSL